MKVDERYKDDDYQFIQKRISQQYLNQYNATYPNA